MEKAVFPVAGLGTRMLPATKAVPKEVLPLYDRPAIHYTVEEAVRSGFSKMIFVTSKGKEAILNYFDRDVELEEILMSKGKKEMAEFLRSLSEMAEFIAIRQGVPMGLGHAVLQAKAVVGGEPFAVVLPDDIVISDPPLLRQMRDLYLRTGKSVVALYRVAEEQIPSFGIADAEVKKDGQVVIHDLVEKPSIQEAPSDLAVIGRYILEPEIFSILEKTPPGRGGEIQLTDALKVLAKEGRLLGFIFKGKRLDIGNPEGFLKASLEIAAERGVKI